jgi:hypothetical protein
LTINKTYAKLFEALRSKLRGIFDRYEKICEKTPRIRGAKNHRFENNIQLTVISGVMSFRPGAI